MQRLELPRKRQLQAPTKQDPDSVKKVVTVVDVNWKDAEKWVKWRNKIS